jgi:hypothetical protein
VTNATRSTTTPLVATSEFNLNLTSGTFATWTLRAFDSGMKGQNCEARFSYRGFATATTKAEIVQNSLVVAHLTLTPSTDPRIASINFPCGDLANATTFRIAQTTANMTGTNEIGAIYTGLATNMANVAQAETVAIAFRNTAQAIATSSSTNVIFNNEDLDVYGEFDTSTGIFTAKRAGVYAIEGNTLYDSSSSWNQSEVYETGIIKNGSTFNTQRVEIQTTGTFIVGNSVFGTTTLAVGDTIALSVFQNSGASINLAAASTRNRITIKRFPASSELVVTPERQNWYVSAVVSGGLPNLGTITTALSEITNSTLTLYPESGSQPVATLCSGTNAPPTASTSTTTCAAGDESVGITFTPPSVGSYEVCAEFSSSLTTGAGGQADVTFQIQETATNNNVALTTFSGSANAGFSLPNATYQNVPVNICQIMQVNSIGQKAYRLFRYTAASGTITTNVIIANDSQGKRNLRWKVTPVTNQSNSALYVQGPVLGANTGAAIPASYVGEEIKNASAVSTTGTTTINTEVDVTNASITLTPGVWELQYTASLGIERGGWANTVIARARITDSANTAESGTESALYLANANAVVAGTYSQQTITKRINLTASKTFKLRLTCSESSSVAICYVTNGNITGGITGDDATTYIRAVRIN